MVIWTESRSNHSGECRNSA